MCYILFLLFIFCACNNKQEEKAQDDLDAAREFIRAALDGKFDQARNYLLPDSINIQYMDAAERSYNRSDNETKNGYKAASINIHKVEPLNDSSTIVVFSNSYKNDHDSLKVIKWKEQWLVDLKFLYLHSVDSVGQ